MAAVRDELLTREITREELKVLVDEFVANGGTIKQYKEEKAYSYLAPLNVGQRNAAGQVQARKSLRSWLIKPTKLTLVPKTSK